MQTVTRWGPVVIWMAVIFVLSSQSSLPRGPDPIVEIIMRKLAHVSEYALLALLIARALEGWTTLSRGAMIRALALTVAYAVTDEIHQEFVPLRTSAPTDVVVDTAGAFIALALLRLRALSGRSRKTSSDSHSL